MSRFNWLGMAMLVGTAAVGASCTQKAADTTTDEVGAALDATKEGVDTTLDATKEGAAVVIDDTQQASEKAADASRNIAEKTVDKTKEIATATGRKATEVVSATGEAITDGWITTTVSARFVDEALLKGSHINVDTNDHVVTLKGTVKSDAARVRAAEVARTTKGVTRVINQLVVG